MSRILFSTETTIFLTYTFISRNFFDELIYYRREVVNKCLAFSTHTNNGCSNEKSSSYL